MMTLDLAIYLRPKIKSGHESSILFSYVLFLRNTCIANGEKLNFLQGRLKIILRVFL